MKYNTTTYKIKDKTVNKITISEECWIMVYDKSTNFIQIEPLLVSNIKLETINDFYIKDTEEELLEIINSNGLIKHNNEEQTKIDKAIKEITDYVSLQKKPSF